MTQFKPIGMEHFATSMELTLVIRIIKDLWSILDHSIWPWYVEDSLCHDKPHPQEQVGGREEWDNQKTQTKQGDPVMTFRAPPEQWGKREGEEKDEEGESAKIS